MIFNSIPKSFLFTNSSLSSASLATRTGWCQRPSYWLLQPPEPPFLGGRKERRGALPLCTPRWVARAQRSLPVMRRGIWGHPRTPSSILLHHDRTAMQGRNPYVPSDNPDPRQGRIPHSLLSFPRKRESRASLGGPRSVVASVCIAGHQPPLFSIHGDRKERGGVFPICMPR